MGNKNRYGNYYSQAINNNAPSAEEVKPAEEVVVEAPVEEPAPVVEETPVAASKVQKTGKIIIVYSYGCMVQDEDGQNIMVYGKEYAEKSKGETITFDYEE